MREFNSSPQWSPFVIVLFGAMALPEVEILDTLGLRVADEPDQSTESQRLRSQVAIATSAEWKAIASDWLYGLWHNAGTRPGLWALARKYRIFAYSMGDSDSSYSFHLFEHGELARESVVYQAHGAASRNLIFDSGARLPGEPAGELRDRRLPEDLVALAAANGFRYEVATDVSYWWVEGIRDAAEREEALVRTSWHHYRPPQDC